MAFGTSGTALGTAVITSSANTIDIGTTATPAADTLILVWIAKTNTGTGDADYSEVTSVTDSKGNNYTKCAEFTNGQGAADAGATISVWRSVTTVAFTNPSTITINLSANVTDLAARARYFTKTAGKKVVIAGTVQTLANDAADPGSMSLASLASKQYLFVRGIASESETTAFTATASHTSITSLVSTTSGTTDTNIVVAGEYRAVTATGDTSDPTVVAADTASVFFALEEVDSITPLPGKGAVTHEGTANTLAVTENNTTLPVFGAVLQSGTQSSFFEQDYRLPDACAVVCTGETSFASESFFYFLDAAATVYTGEQPTEVMTNNSTALPDACAKLYTGEQPTESKTDHKITYPVIGSLIYTGTDSPIIYTDNHWTAISGGKPGFTVGYDFSIEQAFTVGYDFILDSTGIGVFYAGHLPTLINYDNQWTHPDFNELAYTGKSPSLLNPDHRWAVPDASSVVYTGDTVCIDTGIGIDIGSIDYVGESSTLLISDNQWSTPEACSVEYSCADLTIALSDHQWSLTDSGLMHYAGELNSPSFTDNQTVLVDISDVVYLGNDLNPAVTYHQFTQPGCSAIDYQSYTSAEITSDNHIVCPTASSVDFTLGYDFIVDGGWTLGYDLSLITETVFYFGRTATFLTSGFASLEAGAVDYQGQETTSSISFRVNSDVGEIHYQGEASALSVNTFLFLDVGSIHYQGEASGSNKNIITLADAGLVDYAGITPELALSDHQTSAPDCANQLFTGEALAALLSNNPIASILSGLIDYSLLDSTLLETRHHWIDVANGLEHYAGQAETSLISDLRVSHPDAAAINYDGTSPALVEQLVLAPDAANILYSGQDSILGTTLSFDHRNYILYLGQAPVVQHDIMSGVALVHYTSQQPTALTTIHEWAATDAANVHYETTASSLDTMMPIAYGHIDYRGNSLFPQWGLSDNTQTTEGSVLVSGESPVFPWTDHHWTAVNYNTISYTGYPSSILSQFLYYPLTGLLNYQGLSCAIRVVGYYFYSVEWIVAERSPRSFIVEAHYDRAVIERVRPQIVRGYNPALIVREENFTEILREDPERLYTGFDAPVTVDQVIWSLEGEVVYRGNSLALDFAFNPPYGEILYVSNSSELVTTDNQFSAADTGILAYRGEHPVANMGENQVAQPEFGEIVYEDDFPVVAQTYHQFIDVWPSVVWYTGNPPFPNPLGNKVSQLQPAVVSYEGFASAWYAGENRDVELFSGQQRYESSELVLDRTYHETVNPDSGLLFYACEPSVVVVTQSYYNQLQPTSIEYTGESAQLSSTEHQTVEIAHGHIDYSASNTWVVEEDHIVAQPQTGLAHWAGNSPSLGLTEHQTITYSASSIVYAGATLLSMISGHSTVQHGVTFVQYIGNAPHMNYTLKVGAGRIRYLGQYLSVFRSVLRTTLPHHGLMRYRGQRLRTHVNHI